MIRTALKKAVPLLLLILCICQFLSCTSETSHNNQVETLIIDTDAGLDDLMAIAFLLDRREINMEAITISNGLANVKQGAKNICKLLALAKKEDIPVYVGSSKPLEGDRAFPLSWRKQADELPGIPLPASSKETEAESASAFLVNRLKRDGQKVKILALGPLTNLAQAFQESSDCVNGIDEIVIMGGALDVPGNVFDFEEFKSPSDQVEWNIFVDPEAANIVFESGAELLLIPLDATNAVPIDTNFLSQFNTLQVNELGALVGEFLESIRSYAEKGLYCAWDPLAAVALVRPDVVQTKAISLAIETQLPHAGQTKRMAQGMNQVVVATGANPDLFFEIFTESW